MVDKVTLNAKQDSC